MSSTKNNRIKRLITKIEKKPERITSKKTPECYIKINYYELGKAEIDRRDQEIKRLRNALGKRFDDKTTGGHYYETPGKKERMGKFAHKKDSRAKKAEAKQNAKKSKGMKKGG